jgi:hypothetical protein
VRSSRASAKNADIEDEDEELTEVEGTTAAAAETDANESSEN